MTAKKTAAEKKEYRKVALAGSASSSAGMVPYEDSSFSIWGLAWRSMKRADRMFDMHTLGEHRKRVPKDYIARLRSLNVPVYLQEAHPEVPNSYTYPLEEIIEFLSSVDPYANGDYFASSIAYMLAMAIYEKFDEIHLYGIDLIDSDEYQYQRPNTEYLVGLARGMGIKVYIPDTSAICKFTHRYGYDQPMDLGPITPELLKEKIEEFTAKRDDAHAMSRTADGAMQACESLLKLLEHAQRGRQKF